MPRALRCWEIHCGPGVNYFHEGMVDKAIDAYQRILSEATPRPAIVHSWLGIAYCHKGMIREAMAAYQKFLGARPRFTIDSYHFDVCSCHSELTAEIIGLFEQILEKNPHCALCHYYLGVAYYYRGELDRSIEKLTKATGEESGSNLYADSLAEVRRVREHFYGGT